LFPIIGYLTLIILVSAALGTLFQLQPITYAWDTHMTLHNLIDQPGESFSAQMDIAGGGSCIAQAGSNCEAGADYVWYLVNLYVPNATSPLNWGHTVSGIYGSCDLYIQPASTLGEFSVKHHCSAAEKAGLEPPSNQSKK
jgi:hypothetical protein